MPYVRDALDHLRAGIRQLDQRGRSGVLTISVIPTLASTWLKPRLSRFRDLHPEVEVHLSATTRVVDLEREPVDAAIRFGTGERPGLWNDYIFAANKTRFAVRASATTAPIRFAVPRTFGTTICCTPSRCRMTGGIGFAPPARRISIQRTAFVSNPRPWRSRRWSVGWGSLSVRYHWSLMIWPLFAWWNHSI